MVGLVGPLDEAAKRLTCYAEAGVDEIAVVPACTEADPAGRHTLRELAALSGTGRCGPVPCCAQS